MSTTSLSDVSGSTWSPLVISLFGAICTIFLFLIFYSILKKQCSLFHAPPFRDRSLTRLLNGNHPTEDFPIHFQSHGLDPAILYSLPTIQFRNYDNEKGQSSADCAVCLGEFEEGEWLRLLPSCAHIFHVSCVDTWFQTHSNCPLCRTDVVNDISSRHDYSVSMSTLMETLRREDAYRETSYTYHVQESELMQNPLVCWTPPRSMVSPVSQVSSAIANNHQNPDCPQTHCHNLREGSSSRNGYYNNHNAQWWIPQFELKYSTTTRARNMNSDKFVLLWAIFLITNQRRKNTSAN